MNIISLPSPNHDSRDGHAIDMLVLHYTGMKTAQDALDRLCDANAKVSAHYVVDEDGTIYRLVAESERAWHAGVSSWRGNTNINQRSIGIEIVNPGHEFGYRPFPKAQMESVAQLCKGILARHPIPPRNVVAHSDVAPARKDDPGELFDWAWLAGEGVGVFPSFSSPSPLVGEGGERELGVYGYETIIPEKTILAFQRHFRPKNLSGQWDNECERLLASLLAMV